MKPAKTYHLLFLLITLVLFGGCTTDEEITLYVGLDTNGDMEEVDPVNSNYAEGWQLRAGNHNPPNNYIYRRTDAFAASGNYSVMLKADEVDSPIEFWYLLQEIETFDIPIGGRVVLSVKVKTVNLEGSGFEVALHGIHEYEPNLGIERSTYDISQNVSGTTDWQEYRLEVPVFPGNIRELNVLLILSPNTTGEVYFDDFRLGFVEN